MAHTTRRSSFVSSRNDENAYSDVEDPNWDQLESSSVLSDDDSNNIAENEVSSLTLDTKQELLTILLPRTRVERKTAEMMARSPRFNYSKELDSCLGYVATCAYHEEIADRHTVASKTTHVDFMKEAVSIMATMHRTVLRHLVGGNIFRAVEARQDRELVALFNPMSEWMLHAQEQNTPGIYVRGLVNMSKNAPSPSQWQEAVGVLLGYVSGNEATHASAAAIDNVGKGTSFTENDMAKGFRRYINGKVERVSQVTTFCAAMQKRLEGTQDAEKHVPLPKVSMYVGYSATISSRTRTHEKKTSSWLQHLVLAAFTVLYPKAGFAFDTYPVCFMWRQEHVKIAEVLLTVITDSTYVTGGGLFVTQARISTSSSKSTGLGSDDAWSAHQAWRDNNTDFKKNEGNELEKLRELHKLGWPKPAYERPIDRLVREVEELEAELARQEGEDNDPDEDELWNGINKLEQRLCEEPVDRDLDSDDERLHATTRKILAVLKRSALARAPST